MLQLLRRHAGLVDRQAVAARPRVAEQPVARDARRQLLQSLVGRPQLPAPRVQRLRGVDRARRRRLSVLRQDEAADRQPARGQPDRDPRLARPACPPTRRSRWAIPSAWASRTAGARQDVHRAVAHATTGRRAPTENLCIGCDRFHEQVLGPVLEAARQRRRAAKGSAAAAPPRRVIDIAQRGTLMRAAHWMLAAALAAPVASAVRARAGAALERRRREGARPDRQLERVGRRREDQRVHRSGSGEEVAKRYGVKVEPREAEGHRRGGHARRGREGGGPRHAAAPSTSSGSTARTSSR